MSCGLLCWGGKLGEKKKKMLERKPKSGAQKWKNQREKLQLRGYFKATSIDVESDSSQKTATKEAGGPIACHRSGSSLGLYSNIFSIIWKCSYNLACRLIFMWCFCQISHRGTSVYTSTDPGHWMEINKDTTGLGMDRSSARTERQIFQNVNNRRIKREVFQKVCSSETCQAWNCAPELAAVLAVQRMCS